MNISDFRAKLSNINGLQKLNKYRVRFNIPNKLFGLTNGTRNTTDIVQYMEYFTNSVDLPGSYLIEGVVQRYGYGPAEKKPIAPAFNDSMMEFFNDGKSSHLDFFQDWMNLIVNYNMKDGITGVGLNGMNVYEVAYKWEYAVDCMIDLYDTSGQRVHTTVLRECYPNMIVDTKLSADPQPTFMKIGVQFNYFDWHRIPATNND
jgi:hypothetical protein